MSEPKRPRVDDPEQQDEQQVAEFEGPESLLGGYPAAEGDGLEGDGLEELDPLTQAFEEAQSLQQALETVSTGGAMRTSLPPGTHDLLLLLHCCCAEAANCA
jgi:hypothetical protein